MIDSLSGAGRLASGRMGGWAYAWETFVDASSVIPAARGLLGGMRVGKSMFQAANSNIQKLFSRRHPQNHRGYLNNFPTDSTARGLLIPFANYPSAFDIQADQSSCRPYTLL